MATLFGTKIQDTYDGLLKVTDNIGITGTKKFITDGLGVNSSVKISSADFEVANFFFIDVLSGQDPSNYKVGINTSTPTQMLHVVGNVAVDGELHLLSNSEVYGIIKPENSIIKFYLGDGVSATGTPTVIISGDGHSRLGIGVASPDEALHVVGDALITGDSHADAFKPAATTEPIKFKNFASTELMRITNTGLVGIANNSPSYTLDVTGTARVSGDTYFVTQGNSDDSNKVATTAYVKNLIEEIPAGLVFQGTWDASTNTPTLTSGSGTTGHFYIVATNGATNLDGITDWKVGDWAVFVEQGQTDQWEKIDNSSVLDGSGTGQKVTLWSGSGTSNTLTDAPITISGNDATFAGDISATNANITTALDVGSFIYVGGNNSIFAENNLRFKSSGAAYIDHNTVSQSIKFRLSNSSSLDVTPLEVTPSYLSSTVDMYFGDDHKIRLGAGSDLKIYHKSPNQDRIESLSSYLVLEAGNVILRNNGGTEDYAKFLGNSAVELYYNNSKKFETTNTGVTVTGNIASLTANFSDNVYLSGGQLYLGASNSTTNDSYRLYSASGQFVLASRESGTWTTRFDIDTSGKATFAGTIGIGATPTTNAIEIDGADGTSYVYFKSAAATTGARVGLNSDDLIIENKQASGNIIFDTSAIERMRISSTGLVGIGLTNPAVPLDVEGKIRSNDSNSGDYIEIFCDGSNSGDSYIENTNNNIQIKSAFATSFSTSGSVAMFINNSQKVGIGTASPSEKLEVSGNVQSTGLKLDVNTSMYTQNASLSYYSATNAVYLNGAGNSGWLRLNASGTSNDSVSINLFGINAGNTQTFKTNSVERMRITSTGSVGIGITSPSQQLHVANAVQIDGTNTRTLSLNNSVYNYINSNAALDIIPFPSAHNASGHTVLLAAGHPTAGTTNDKSGGSLFLAGGAGKGTGAGGDIVFRVAQASSTSGSAINTYATAVTINDNKTAIFEGSVGIGDSSPSAKLQVAGGIQMADDTASASADKVGTLKYYTSGNNSYVDMCMQTGATTYEWINIVQNNW